MANVRIDQYPLKPNPVSSDYVLIQDSEDLNVQGIRKYKKVNAGDLPNVNNVVGGYTKAEMLALQSASEFFVGNQYLIANATSAEIPIIVEAKTTNTLKKNCQIVNDNFDIMEYDLTTDIFTGVDFLAAVIRNSGGTWAYVDDNDHDKRNFGAISTQINTVTVNYRRNDYNRVLTLTATPDESYVKKGVACGASVGTALSLITLQRQDSCYGYIFFQGGVFDKDFDKGITSAVFDNSNGNLVITHEDFGDVFAISLQARYGAYVPQIQEVGTNTVTVRFYDWDGNVITTPDAAMILFFSRAYNKELTSLESEVAGANIWLNGQMAKVI